MTFQSASSLLVNFGLLDLFNMLFGQILSESALDNSWSWSEFLISSSMNEHQKETMDSDNTIGMKKNELIDNIIIDICSKAV